MKADSKFKQITHEEVLPAIGKAFCSLNQEAGKDAAVLIKYKAEQMKQVVCAYIDGQASCFESMMELTVSVISNKKHQNEDLYSFSVIKQDTRICSQDRYSETELLTILPKQLKKASRIVIKPTEN